MDRSKRIEYLIVTHCVLITGFLIYGLLGSVQPLVENNRLLSFLLFGCIGGFGFSAILSTIILTANFLSKKKLRFRIVAAIFWPITFACAVCAGFFCYIPYQIYNIVKVIKEKPLSDTTEEPL